MTNSYMYYDVPQLDSVIELAAAGRGIILRD